ncbi:unnamed protein product [Miscanthus lutarioriparius]|uniref:Peptidase A1 domain-containing protein n=1 Tax=Miscanthus lutarioriparius TaxID=422564 RepID=A0A811MSU4_9POAL|nr:unnamed protein product [Miscanthus lutarioriparius]
MASQPASSKVFAHCLNTVDGVGIIAIGNVGQLQKTTSLVRPNYIVNLSSVAVAGSTLQLPTDTFYGDGKGAMIDIGTTSIYLPEIFYKHPDTLFWSVRDILYMKHHGRVDDVFPKITFHFDGGLALDIYPHDYLLNNGSDWYYVVLRNGRSQPEHMKNLVILGDIVFSNKLVVYDLENQVIGWTDHDCSSGSPALTPKMSEL